MVISNERVLLPSSSASGRRCLIRFVISILLCARLAGASQAQPGGVAGRVSDPQGEPLPGVTVTLSGPTLPATVAVTNERGDYRLASVPAGTYVVLFDLPGFETTRRESVVVPSGGTATVDVVMALAPAERPNERLRFSQTVVVTAQLRPEDVRQVPISITAFTSDTIEEAGIQKPADALALVPNAFMAETFTVGSSLVMSRGIAQTHNGSPPLAVVVDGVYQGNQKQFNHELFDIERLEVLKGPEGALYGRNSIGGAINLVTKQPTKIFEGEARASLGNGGSQIVGGAVSGPIGGDSLLVRLSGQYKDSDGLIENTYLNKKADPYTDKSGRAQVRWLAGPRWTLDGKISASNTNGGAVLYSIFPTTGHANDFSYPPEENILGASERTMSDYATRVEWTGEPFTVTGIVGYSAVDESYRGDADFSHPGGPIAFPLGQLGQGQDLNVKMFSQELRVTSPDDRRVRWSGGFYRIGTTRDLVSQLFADTNGTVAGFVPIVRLGEHDDNTAWAVYGQADAKVNDRWAFSTSVRYDEDSRGQTDLTTQTFRRTVFDAWQPRFTATYTASSRLLAYLNVGRGFRSGGYNAPTVDPAIFKEELSTNVELGARATLADKRVHLDGAVYGTRLENAQFFRVDFASASQVIDNLRRVGIRGAEIAVTALPAQGLEVSGGLGVNDSTIDDFDGSGTLVGNQTPMNIRSTLNLGAQYAHLIGRAVVGMVRIDFERRGKQYWTPDNLDVQNPLNLLNLRFSVLKGAWTVVAWAKNVTDRKYYVEYGDATWSGIISGDDIGWLGRPRTAGVDLVSKF